MPVLFVEVMSASEGAGQGDYNGVLTSGLIHRENGGRFLTPLVCAGCLITGLEQLVRVSPEEFGFVRPEKRLPLTL